jgi:quinol monooxygenase YgiN
VLAVVWNFQVQPGREKDFEALHGADGEWTALSRKSRSFLGSSFLRDEADARRYLVIEYWSEMVVYERHRGEYSIDMEELQERRAKMVIETIPVGLFEALDVPDRFGPTWSRRDGR